MVLHMGEIMGRIYSPLCCVAVLFLLLPCGNLHAQPAPTPASELSLQESILHRPLYLRGFWMGYTLDFDASGQPIGRAKDRPQPGPFTLSGIEVHDLAIKGAKLVLHAERIALVADLDGSLKRRTMLSTTLMLGTMQKQYRAKEMVKITVQADAGGSFDAPLHAIFANSLDDLALSAPPAWRCYAGIYLTRNPAAQPTVQRVNYCVESAAKAEAPDMQADATPTMLTQPEPRGTREASELGISGETEVFLLVDAHGIPRDFQIIRPLGGGLDEDTLQALSQCRFAPATRDGVPVSSGLLFSMQYR